MKGNRKLSLEIDKNTFIELSSKDKENMTIHLQKDKNHIDIKLNQDLMKKVRDFIKKGMD